jgi:hypothetical protein
LVIAGGGSEQARAAGAAGDDPGPVGGVDLQMRAVIAAGVGAAGGPGKAECARVVVGAGPVGDHVRDEAAVVSGGEHKLAAGGPADVDAMHPHVAGVDDVHQVAERPHLGAW